MINRIWKPRYLRVAGLAAAAVAVAGAAVVVTASAAGMSFGLRQSPASTATVDASKSSAVCSNFMKHLAVDLSKSQAEINAAFQKAIAETLADEVKSGQITQAQADALKKKLANQTPCNLPSHAPRPGGEKALAAFMQQYLAAAASALGITETQLQTDLRSGQSLSQVAAAQHVTEADFRTKVIAGLTPALDKAVTDKKITAAQEQEILTRLQTAPLPLWNTAAKPRPKPGTTATPSPKTA
jgi:hypothetical protein